VTDDEYDGSTDGNWPRRGADPDPERSEGVGERIDARHYGDPEGYRVGADRCGACWECGEVSTATITVHEATGVAGWTCPECGNVQEPPRSVGD
jgi:hypothetical protein